MYENDAYQQRNANGFMNGKKISSNSSKLIKGIKGAGPDTMDDSYGINDRINEQKYVKLDFTSINKFGLNGLGNEDDGIIIIKDDNNNGKPPVDTTPRISMRIFQLPWFFFGPLGFPGVGF